MSASLLRITLAIKLTKNIFTCNESQLAQEHNDYDRETQLGRERDMKNPTAVLLPLVSYSSRRHLTGQLGLWLKRLEKGHQAFQHYPALALTAASFVSITVPKLLLTQAMSMSNLYGQLILEIFWTGISAYIILAWHGGPNLDQVQLDLQTFVNGIPLLLLSFFELKTIFDGRSEPSSGTFELTAYLVAATVVTWAQNEYMRTKRLEEDLLQSQAVMNRVATEVLSEPSLRTGLAILHLGATATSEDRITLLRYNKSFIGHLRLKQSAPSSSQDINSPALEKHAIASYLESIQLCARRQVSDGTSYKAALQRAVKERVNYWESDLTGNAPDLFAGDFFDPESRKRNESKAPASGERQRQSREDGDLQIRTQVLSDKNRLYLLRVERFSPCKQLQAQSNVVSLQIEPEPKMVSSNNINSSAGIVAMTTPLQLPKLRMGPKRLVSQENLRPRRNNVDTFLTQRLDESVPTSLSLTVPRLNKLHSRRAKAQPQIVIRTRQPKSFQTVQEEEGAEKGGAQIVLLQSSDDCSLLNDSSFDTTKKGKQINSEIGNKSRSSRSFLQTEQHEFFDKRQKFHRKNLLQKNFKSVKGLYSNDELQTLQQQSPNTVFSSSSQQNKSFMTEMINPPKGFNASLQKSSSRYNRQVYFNSDGDNSNKSKMKKRFSSHMPDSKEMNTLSMPQMKRLTGLKGPCLSGALIKSGSNSLQEKQKSSRGDNKQFVFKIIHDLRHPTQAVKDGLQRIIEKSDSFKRKSSQAFCINHRYQGDQRAQIAVRALKNFAKQFGGQRMSSQRGHLSTDFRRNSLINRKHSRSQPIDLSQNISPPQCVPSNAACHLDPSIKSNIQQLRNCFWNLPLENFAAKGNLRRQKNSEDKSLEIKVVRNESESLLISQRDLQDQSNNSNSDSASVSEDSSFDHSENQEEAALFVMSSQPKNSKELARVSQEIVHRVDQLREESHSNYKTNSLAVDSLIYQSSIAKRLGVCDDRILRGANQMRISSNPVPAISNVVNTLLTIKESQNIRWPRSPKNSRLPLLIKRSSDHQQQVEVANAAGGDKKSLFEPFGLKNENRVVPSQVSQSSLTLSSTFTKSQPGGELLSQAQLASFVHLLLSERRKLIRLIEGHMKNRLGIKKQSKEMLGYVEMMSVLLTDLMNLAMLNSNTFKLINDYFDCNKLVRRCLRSLRVQSRMKDVRLEGPIFDKAIDRIYFKAIFGDENRYGQIITNFLTNGIKFTPRKGVVSVILRVIETQNLQAESSKQDERGEDDSFDSSESIPDKGQGTESLHESATTCTELVTFQMVFRDSGYGISKENQEKLFSDFNKLDDTQEQNKQGVGLGLSICREIINANGGSVSIESAMGKGTDFIISLQTKCKIDQEQINNARSQQSLTSSISLLNSDSSGSISLQSELSEVSENISEQASGSQESTENILNIGGSPQKQNNFYYRSLFTIAERKSSQASSSKVSSSLEESSSSSSCSPRSPSIIDKEPTVCLVANDCPFLLMSVKQILSEYFDIVHTADDGQQAVKMVECRPVSFYRAILLDYNMPIMNGVEAALIIKLYLNPRAKVAVVAETSQESNRIPHLYAVTQESDQNILSSIRQAGFKEIMSLVTGNEVKKIMEGAGLEFKTVPKRKGRQSTLKRRGSLYEDEIIERS